MNGLRLITAFWIVAGTTTPLFAQGIFTSRKVPVDPAFHIEKIASTVQGCRNDNDRTRAVQELRQFDTVKHPQVVPLLVGALQTDKSSSVRIEAARSLGRVRPLLPAAHEALSRASMRDSSFRVRWQARTSLAVYTLARINPYNYPPRESKQTKVTVNEPPVAQPGKVVIEGAAPNSGQPLPDPSPFAKRLPIGPNAPQIGNVAPPKNQAPQGALVPPANPGAFPLGQPRKTEGVPLPSVPPLPAPGNRGAETGPILAPPVNVPDF